MNRARINGPTFGRSGGFTIIELLIVIIVIGILATIILLAYTNVTRQAAISRIKYDLEQAYKQLDVYNVNYGAFPVDQPAALAVVKVSDGTTLEYSKTTAGYCITTSSTTAQKSFYFDSVQRSLLEGTCPGHVGYTGGGSGGSGGSGSTTVVGTVTSLTTTNSTACQDGVAANAYMKFPRALAIARGSVNSGPEQPTYLYIADTGNHTIRNWSLFAAQDTLGRRSGNCAAGSADGLGTSASYNSPSDITYSITAGTYIADRYNNEIRYLPASGAASQTVAGYTTSGDALGTLTTARFSQPIGVSFSKDLNKVAILDYGNYKIKLYNRDNSGAVTFLAGSGVAGIKDGTGAAAQFGYTRDITTDSNDDFIIIDADSPNVGTGNTYIRRVTRAGVVTTMYTTTEYAFQQITMDPTNDDMYLTDAYCRVVRLTKSGVDQVVAGVKNSCSFTDGTGTDARFGSALSGIAFEPDSRSLFVTDNRIRKITLAFN